MGLNKLMKITVETNIDDLISELNRNRAKKKKLQAQEGKTIIRDARIYACEKYETMLIYMIAYKKGIFKPGKN